MNKYFYLYPFISITTVLLIISISSSAQLTPSFTATPLSGCTPLVVSFTDQSVGSPVSWQWNLGNGTLSSQRNPTTTYFNGGNYSITLTVTNASGVSRSITKTNYIQVNNKPDVNFSAVNTSGCFPLRTSFTDNTTPVSGVNVSWAWDFGDGSLSSARNPVHTYLNAGTFPVTLKVTNSGGCSRTYTRPGLIQVSPGVVVNFSNTLPVACNPPETIQFTNSSAGPGTLSYEWTFGDGTLSAATNPSHTYNAGGIYDVRLITRSSLGCVDTLTRYAALTIRDVNTDFSGSLSTCVGVPVNFNNISIPVPVSSYWDFGDGSTSNISNPSKTWSNGGVYAVKLINTYPTCTDSIIKQITVKSLPQINFTASDTLDCDAPFTVNFTGLSPSANGWSWDFGDGNTSALQNPSHTYLINSNYTVKLTVTGANGCVDSLKKTDFIKIQRPVVSFLGLPREGCIPYTIHVTPGVNAIDGVASYYWDFGDGSFSTLPDPSHTYTLQGTYTVKLIIRTNTGCIDSSIIVNGVRVGSKPVANFNATPLVQCAGQPVQFTNLTVPSDHWLWDFGEGSSSELPDPLFAFGENGTFNITLIATNNGCKDTLTKMNYVTILTPVARFSPSYNCTNKKRVLFTDQSVQPQTWFWDFGDGSTSTLQNPGHVYADFGNYDVSLTVTNGSCTNTTVHPVILFNEVPDFYANSDTVCTSQFARFNAFNFNQVNISGYTWDFGDGVIQAGGPVQPHFYASPGTYSVKLTITDIRGCVKSLQKLNYITVFGPKAAFTADVSSGCNPMGVNFSDHSVTDGIHGIVSWLWNFGDGDVEEISAPPFTHVYDTVGSFIPYLTVTDSYGCKSALLSPTNVYITDPTPAFTTSDSLTCTGAAVQFLNTSGGDNLIWNWDFGDGTSSSGTNPSKVYNADGIFTVKLFITDINGCRDSLIRNNYIKVRTPVAAFSVNDSISSCSPFEVIFSNASLNSISALWDFGDGTSSLVNGTHYYSAPGMYTAKLQVGSHGGCTSTANKMIRLYPPDAELTYAPLAGCSPMQATFHISTPGPVTYLWDLSDGSTVSSTQPDLIYDYLLPGDFLPKVIMEDQTGCRIPVPGNDMIHVTKSDVYFNADDSLFCDRGTVTFNNLTTSNGNINGYNWNFGDGSSSVQNEPIHIYTSPGIYTVRLIAGTSNGCSDTAVKIKYIKVAASPVIDIAGNTSVCMNSELTLRGLLLQQDTSVLSWKWDFGNGNHSVLQDPPHQYYEMPGVHNVQLFVMNSSGCSVSKDTSVVVYSLPLVDAGPDRTIAVGSPVLLTATGSRDNIYLWSPAQDLNCANCQSTTALPKFSRKYIVRVTDANGCTNSDAVNITVTCTNHNIFIPNTFSPNNDGMNDIFFVRGTGLFSIKNMRIFNRWGELVFAKSNFVANDASAGWNGIYRSLSASVDVYTYLVDIICDNNELITYKGNVTLIK